MKHLLRHTAALLALLLVVPALAACEEDRATVTVLLADASSGHWQRVDVPTFRERVDERCAECEVVIRSAGGDAETQARQLESAIEAETEVLVLDAVDPEAAEGLVGRAGEIPVVAWNAFVPGADHHVGSDPERVGRLLGRHVTGTSSDDGPGPRVLALDAPGNDPTATVALRAALTRLEKAPARVTTAAAPGRAAARQLVAGRVGQTAYDVVLAATDEQAAGAATALDEASDPPALVAPRAGMATARRIVTGGQEMSVYEPFQRMATRVADVSLALLAGRPPEGGEDHEGVNSWRYPPRSVTVDSLTTVMVPDGALEVTELCRRSIRDRCTDIGLL